jgi:hypothetical protein
MLFCQFANEVWKGIKPKYGIQLKRREFILARMWTLNFLERSSVIEATSVMVAMWHIWDARNKFHEEGTMAHPSSIAVKVKAYVEMLLLHLYKPKPNHRRESSSSTTKWTPPPVGTVLLNVDVAIFKDTRRMGAGMVARDHTGTFIAALGEQIDNVMLPELAEAIVVHRAVLFAQEGGFTKVIIATNCLYVIQRL